MKYLLYGDDALTLRFRKHTLIQEFCKKYPEARVATFSFPEASKEQSPEEELSTGFFSEPKILVFENLASLWEIAKERGEALLNTKTEATCLFIEYQKLPKASPFLKAATAAGLYGEFYETKKRESVKLFQYLQEELRLGFLDQKTLNIIKERSGGDDELTLQNIRKVLTFTAGNPVSEKGLNELVPVLLETKVFDALDALALGQKERALVLFQNILKNDDIFRILPLCAWQIRQFLLVREAKESLGSQKENIANKTGIHPFVVQKVLRVLPNYSRSRLAKGLRILSSLDIKLKNGQITPAGALQHFIFQW